MDDDMPRISKGGGKGKLLEAPGMPPTSDVGVRQLSMSGVDSGLSQLAGCSGGASQPVALSPAAGGEPTLKTIMEEKVSDVVTFAFVRNPDGGWYTDGRAFFTSSGAEEIVNANEVIKCIDSGIGWVKVSSNPTKNVKIAQTIPAMQFMTFSSAHNTQTGLSYPECTYYVYSPLLTYLRQQVPVNCLSDVHIKAAMALVLKQGYTIDHPNVKDTLRAYAHSVAFAYNDIFGARMFRQMITNTSAIGFDEFNMISKLAAHPGLVSYGQVICEASKRSDVEWDLVRTDFVITRASVGVMRRDVDNMGRVLPLNGAGVSHENELTYQPYFATVDHDKRGVCRNFFFRLLSPHDTAHFFVHKSCGSTFNGALKRLLGAREGENVYRTFALSLGEEIFRSRMQALLTPLSDQRVCPQDLRAMYNLLLNGRTLFGDGQDTYPVEAEDLVGPRWTMNEKVLPMLLPFIESFINKNNASRVQHYVDSLCTSAHWAYFAMWRSMLAVSGASEFRIAAASVPHLKRKERIAMVGGQYVQIARDPIIKNVSAQIKNELGKPPPKSARLFVSYGDGVTSGPHIPEYVKCSLDGHYSFVYGNKTLTVFIMAKPREDSLEKIFREICDSWMTPDHTFVAIYSDDSVYSTTIGTTECFNVDISSNDSSQDMPAFLLVGLLCAQYNADVAFALLKQCTLPIKCINPSNRDERFYIQFAGMFEGSGTVLTTTLNHVGSFLIALCTFCVQCHNDEGLTFEECVCMGAQFVGHKVTVEDTGCVLDRVQFLKRSPVLHDGQIAPALNMGALLRSLGSYEGDLTPVQLGVDMATFRTMSDSAKMERFVGGVVQGMKWEPSNSLLAALRERFPSTGFEIDRRSYMPVSTEFGPDGSPLTVEIVPSNIKYATSLGGDEHLMNRYSITEDEIAEVSNVLRSLRVGDVFSHRVFSRIYHVDYGMPTE